MPAEISLGEKPSSEKILKLSNKGYAVCVLTDSQEIYCAGYGSGGMIGNGKNENSSALKKVKRDGLTSGVKFNDVSSSAHVCAVGTDRLLYCWGSNERELRYGMLSTENSNVPVPAAWGNILKIDNQKEYISKIYKVDNNSIEFTPSQYKIGQFPLTVNTLFKLSSETNIKPDLSNQLTIYYTPKEPLETKAAQILPQGSIKLTWKSPSQDGNDNIASQGNNYGKITGYKIWYRNYNDSGVLKEIVHLKNISTDQSEMSYIINNLTVQSDNNKYVFYIAAVNDAGDGSTSSTQYLNPSFLSLSLSKNNLNLDISPTKVTNISTDYLKVGYKGSFNSGYGLKVFADADAADLVHDTNPSLKIPSSSNSWSQPQLLESNSWGMRIPNTYHAQYSNKIDLSKFGDAYGKYTNLTAHDLNYVAVPSRQAPATIMSTNDEVISDFREMIVMFGLNVDRGYSQGQYNQTIKFELVAD